MANKRQSDTQVTSEATDLAHNFEAASLIERDYSDALTSGQSPSEVINARHDLLDELIDKLHIYNEKLSQDKKVTQHPLYPRVEKAIVEKEEASPAKKLKL